MESKGLMIGNYLNTNKECQDDYVEVVEMCTDYVFAVDSAGLTHKKEDLEPIPLTEEWMSILKGSKDSTIYLYKGGDKWFVSILSEIICCCGSYIRSKEIKYVHEWQNAYKFWEDEDLKTK